MIEGHNFVKAYFTNNERTIVESLWVNDKNEVRILEIEAEDDNPSWKELLTYINIDNLHEATYNYIKEKNDDYYDTVIAIARERSLIYDVDTINSNVSVAIAKTLFKDFDPVNDKEALFMFKLGLFEVPKIKDSSNKELKAKLRKAKSIIEALHVSCEICLGKS